MSKVICYVRVSTDKQEVEGTSLDSQQLACLTKAHELAAPDDEIVVLRETFSGLTLERAELTKLRDWARQGQIKAVVTYSCDRLARDGLHLLLLVEEFEKVGAQVVFVTEPHTNTPEGQLLTYVRGWASKLEALKIKERTVRGRKQRAKNGRLPANGKLYGYLYMKGKGEARGIRIPDGDKAKVVKDIFSWYVNDGLSTERIQKRLYALGIAPPNKSSHWHRSTIFRLLSNPAYAGNTITNWTAGGLDEAIEVPGATPAIIDQATFDAAQERLRFNKENSKRRGKQDYLLRGMIYCACGRHMSGGASARKRTYRCTGQNWNPEHYCGRSINADNVEAAVWGQIKAMLADPEIIRTQMSARFGNTQGAAELEAQIKTIDARLKALDNGESAILRQLRLGLTSEEKVERELRQGKQDRENLEREKATIQDQLKGVKRWAEVDIDDLCHNALLNLESPTAEIKRLTLQAFDTRVTVEGSNINVQVAFPIEPSPENSFELRLSKRGAPMYRSGGFYTRIGALYATKVSDQTLRMLAKGQRTKAKAVAGHCQRQGTE